MIDAQVRQRNGRTRGRLDRRALRGAFAFPGPLPPLPDRRVFARGEKGQTRVAEAGAPKS